MPGEMGESCDLEEKVGESSGNNEKMSKTQSSDGYEKIVRQIKTTQYQCKSFGVFLLKIREISQILNWSFH